MIDTKLIETHITRDPEIFKGKPIIKGTRISVELVVGWVESGEPVEQIIDDYPVLTEEDIAAAMAFHEQEQARTRIWTW